MRTFKYELKIEVPDGVVIHGKPIDEIAFGSAIANYLIDGTRGMGLKITLSGSALLIAPQPDLFQEARSA